MKNKGYQKEKSSGPKKGKKDKPWKNNQMPNSVPAQHEKDNWPRKVWPTDQERHKGPKF